jgi:hypothetical protein
MGVLNTLVDTTVTWTTGAGVILAVLLAARTWPLVTSTTKFMLLAVIFSTVANDVFFPTRNYNALDALMGIGGAAVVMGVS